MWISGIRRPPNEDEHTCRASVCCLSSEYETTSEVESSHMIDEEEKKEHWRMDDQLYKMV